MEQVERARDYIRNIEIMLSTLWLSDSERERWTQAHYEWLGFVEKRPGAWSFEDLSRIFVDK